ncbi:hypothetical protein CDL12_01758 [Handroanthus impetiginosus]|uniref:Uncharacterized protein n=1 Tax=Handroanthus impetiginosus TaxID=429701 RepID=A0A2G9I6V7_9LAMI|nr:hypothetical protein CDL12_01758 [Handroanthus impetiginosus]
MFLEILALDGPFVYVCISIPIHGSLSSTNQDKRIVIKPFFHIFFKFNKCWMITYFIIDYRTPGNLHIINAVSSKM